MKRDHILLGYIFWKHKNDDVRLRGDDLSVTAISSNPRLLLGAAYHNVRDGSSVDSL